MLSKTTCPDSIGKSHFAGKNLIGLILSVSLILMLLVSGKIVYAQSTILKLPTTDDTSSFDETKSNDSTLFKLFGDGGFYLSGLEGTGTIPIEGSGSRLMWYPKKSAFRVGWVDSDNWNDENIGFYSIAMGYSTTASGIYSTAMNFFTTASGERSTAMGEMTIASGYNSTAMGFLTIASGIHSTAMGTVVSTNNFIGAFIIGDYSTASVTNSSSSNQMTMRFANGYRLFTNPDATIGALLPGGGNSWTTISDSTKKENFVYADGEQFLSSLSNISLGSWNYKIQNAEEYRHYGPMAQEIFHYFGKDKYGSIGNDTTLATADMDGIIMICLQALEKRTVELQKAAEKISELEILISTQETNLSLQQNMIEEFREEFLETKKSLSELLNEKKHSEKLISSK